MCNICRTSISVSNGQTIFTLMEQSRLEVSLSILLSRETLPSVMLVRIQLPLTPCWIWNAISDDHKLEITGLGLNLTNSQPTTCINDYIASQNKKHSKSVQPLGFEKCLAIIFNDIEFIFNRVQQGDMNYLIESYYAYWLHRWEKIITLIQI